MSVRIRWEPPYVPEDRQKHRWEGIIKAAVGDPIETLDVRLSLAQERHRWHVEASLQRGEGASPAPSINFPYAPRIVAALRSAGKPVD
jgi:hypothetical protein